MSIKQKHPEKEPCVCIVVGPMPFPLKVLKSCLKHKNAKLLFVDGGLVHLSKFHHHAPILSESAIFIGDGDSSQEAMEIKKSDQNLSDLAFTLKFLGKKNNISRYFFLGFLGGRIDHQLFNLGEIAKFMEEKAVKTPSLEVYMDSKIQFLPPGLHRLELYGCFSLGSFKPNKIKIFGDCQYTLKNWTPLFALSSRGLSNIASGTVEIHSKEVLMLMTINKQG